MSEYLIQGETLTSIADEIRELSGTTTAMGLDDMTSNLEEANDEVASQSELIEDIIAALEGKAIGGSGSGEAAEWSENEDAMVSGTLTSYTNDRVKSIGSYAFYDCSKLTTVSFPVCANIGSYAFSNCGSLTTVSFPMCTDIGGSAFAGCGSLTTVSFPMCTDIGGNAFQYCSSLTTVSFPVCTDIGSYAFERCYKLTTVSFPVCTNIWNDAFQYCSSLTTVSFPVCATINYYAFNKCSSLTTVSFPVCTTIGSYAFRYCESLTTVSFPVCASISSNVFQYCYRISNIQLGASSVCKLFNSNAFSSTPFVGYKTYFSGTPHIYVPASLVDAYKSATNWVYFSSYITAIEDMEV